MNKIKVNPEEFIDLDKAQFICDDNTGYEKMYYAPESKRFFRIVNMDNETHVTEYNYKSSVRDFIIHNNTNAQKINMLIKKFDLGDLLDEVT